MPPAPLQLCTELGVSRDQLPLLADVEQGRGVPAICRCLWAAADKCGALGLAVSGGRALWSHAAAGAGGS